MHYKEEEFLRERICQLRISRDISEYQLSLDLGHSQGYIQSITSGRVLPSMKSFFDICNYFDLSPSEFFDPTLKNPTLIHNIMNDLKQLSEDDILLLATVLKRIISR